MATVFRYLERNPELLLITLIPLFWIGIALNIALWRVQVKFWSEQVLGWAFFTTIVISLGNGVRSISFGGLLLTLAFLYGLLRPQFRKPGYSSGQHILKLGQTDRPIVVREPNEPESLWVPSLEEGDIQALEVPINARKIILAEIACFIILGGYFSNLV